MKPLAAVVVILFAQPLQAQWVVYPTRGVPRTPAGAANLQAPALKTKKTFRTWLGSKDYGFSNGTVSTAGGFGNDCRNAKMSATC